MFGLSYIKLAVIAVVLVAVLGLAWTAKHYHEAWVQVTAQLASKQVELDQAVAAGQLCSKNTEKLATANEEKQKEVKKAQEQAAIVAKSNKALASKILSLQSTNPDRAAAALELIDKDKAGTIGK